MHSQPPLPGQISSVGAFLEDFCIDPSRLEKVPKVIIKRLTEDFIKKFIRPPKKSLNEGEDSFSSIKKDRTFTDCPALPQSPSDNLYPQLSANMGVLSTLTPTLPLTSVSPPLKENAPPEPSTSIDSSILNDVRSVLTVGDDDRDSDDEEYLPDLTDPSWEAPSTKKKKHRSPDDKIEKKKKSLDTSNFNKGRDPKLMKDAKKVFQQKQKMFTAKPSSKILSGVKLYGKSTESAQDLRPSDSDVSTSPSQLPSKLLTDLLKPRIEHTTEPSPDDTEIEKRKAQIRENISRGFPQKSLSTEPTPIPEENLPLNEEVTIADEDNNDGQSIAVISDIQGNAISVFANNCDADEEGYDSDQTVTFESPVLSDANLLDEKNNLTQHTISEPIHDSQGYKSKRKYDIQADEGKRKKVKCSSEQPKTHQKKNMVVIHNNISPPKSSDMYPEPMIVKVESIGNKLYQSGGNTTSGDDLALKMTSSREDYLESKDKNWCASPKRSTDDNESVNARAVGDSRTDNDMHLAHTKVMLSKLNKWTLQRKQCDEKIKQAWEEHNKNIAVLEEQKAKYEKKIENLIIGVDNISHNSVRNQPTACTPDNSCTERGQNNLQEESASVLPGPSVSQTESVPSPSAGSIPTTKASVAQAVFPRSTPVSSPNEATPQPPPPQLPVAAPPSTLGTPEPVPRPSTSLSSNTVVPEEVSSKDTEGTKGISIIRQANISQFGKKRSGKKKDKGVKFRVVAKSSLPVTTSVQTKPVEEITRQPARSNTAVGPVQHNNDPITPYYSKNIAPPNVVVSNRMPLPTGKPPPSYAEHFQIQSRQNLPAMSNNISSGNLLFISKGQQQQQHPQFYIMQPKPQVQEQHVIINQPNLQQAQQVHTQQPQIQTHNLQQQTPLMTSQHYVQHQQQQPVQQLVTCPQPLFIPQQQQQQQPQQQSVLQHLLKNGPQPRTQDQQENSGQPFNQNTPLMQPQQSCIERSMSAVTQKAKSQQRNSTKPNNIGQQAHAVGSITASSTPVHSHQSHLLVSATPCQPQPGHSIARPVHPTPQASQIQPKLPQAIQPVRTAIQGSNSLPQLSPHQPLEGTEIRQEEVLPDSPGFSLESCSCFICGSAGEYTCCSGIVYCSRDCQGKDWLRHREECTKVRPK
ncbi:hypothetical protein Pcinc_015990 [Petrolisthes cinctipes]|uniref:MYND-type domain-containing protein n=1 Tax=Petrolisthes cinctipes TaxID=88211 RepID=A0AAE1FTM8_PETCI|nr:hypothetical protein Pcinc_015990 [Petrolisthes cinctipes]